MRLFWKFSLMNLIEQGQRKRERRKQDKKNYKSLYRRRGIVFQVNTELSINSPRKLSLSFSFPIFPE